MIKLKHLLLVSLMVFGLTVLPLAPEVGAINVVNKACTGQNKQTKLCKGSGESLQPLIRKVIRILLTLLGSIAVIMIIVGGIRYTTSDGDASKVQSAKNTVLYSIVGLVIALLSFAIVEFVLSYF